MYMHEASDGISMLQLIAAWAVSSYGNDDDDDKDDLMMWDHFYPLESERFIFWAYVNFTREG